MNSSRLYRCVCGEQFAVPDAVFDFVACGGCGRQYPSTAFASSDAATITLDGDSGSTGPIVVVEPSDPQLGAMLGHFRLLERLAAGGMGVVYRALDESLERYVAIKVLHGQSSAEHVDHLLQEAVAQARINHPHVVHIYYVGKDPDAPFLAMELVEGGSLNSVMKQRQLTFHETTSLGLQLAEAMQQASILGIVHGDIKPGNVLLDRRQQVKLTDFGLALVDHRQQGQRVAGTPQYMAPEMWEGHTSAASDMYALGVTLFEMTFGHRPLNPPAGASASQIANMHRTHAIEFPAPWPKDVPLAWRDILERLLAKSPNDRYESYQDLIAALRAVQPIHRPPAGKAQRALAWIVDSAILQLPLGFLQAGLSLIPATDKVGRASVGAAGLASIFLLILWSSRWGRTPGKAIFQLRVVDRYGLRPSDLSVFVRTLWVMVPVWVNWFTNTLLSLGLSPPLGGQYGFAVVLQGALVIDAVTALFTKRRHSLHDRLLRTEVVLDAKADGADQ